MSFKTKTIDEVGAWLTEEGFSDEVVHIFKENEVDGETFLLLVEDDFKDHVKRFGTRRKLLEKQRAIIEEEKGEPCPVCSVHVPKHIFSAHVSHCKYENEAFNDGISTDSQLDPTGEEYVDYPAVLSESSDEDPVSGKDPSDLDKVDLTTEEDVPMISSEVTVKGEYPIFCKPMNSRTITKREQERPLPIPFPLPTNFHPEVMAGLKIGVLSVPARTKFFSQVAGAIFNVKSYPTKEEYNHVGQLIVSKYPFLKSEEGTGFGYIVEDLKNKLKYLRNSKARVPKRRASENDVPPTKPKRTRIDPNQFPQSPAQVPEMPAGEDEESCERHITFMQKEEKKKTVNYAIIADLMDRTFAYRRNEIMKKPATIESTIKRYPSLRRPKQISAELQRILGKPVDKKWEDVLPKIFKAAELHEHNTYVPSLSQEECSEESKTFLGLVMLTYLLPDTRIKADHTKIVTFIDECADLKQEAKKLGPHPTLIVLGTSTNCKEAYLVCEGTVLCKVPLALAPLILLATFYVFNIHFTPGCTNFYFFLEYHFLQYKPRKRTRLQNFITFLYHLT